MYQIEALIDLYIDANIVLIFAFMVWRLVQLGLSRSNLKRDYGFQLNLTEGAMIAVFLSPVIAYGVSALNAALFPKVSLNAADFAVAQFLNGHVQMEAQKFEAILSFRQTMVEALASGQGMGAQLIIALFSGGAVVAVIVTARSVFNVNQLIRGSYVWRRFGRLDIRLCDTINVPFSTRGLRRRHIFVPSGMLAQPDELRITLSHELQHMRRNDVEWELALTLLRPLFFWNPVYYLWKRNLETLRELSCDQAILRRKRVTPHAYADCLLSVCQRSIHSSFAENITVPKVPFLSFAKAAGRRNFTALHQRISAITSQPRVVHHRGVLFWSAMVLTTIAIAVGASSVRKPADWSQDRLMLSTIVNLERLETRNSGLSLAGY